MACLYYVCRRYFVNRSLTQLIKRSADINVDGMHDWDIDLLVRNRMVWWLCGYHCHPSTMTLRDALDKAMHNMFFNIGVVGVTENPHNFIRALSHVLDWIKPDTGIDVSKPERKHYIYIYMTINHIGIVFLRLNVLTHLNLFPVY